MKTVAQIVAEINSTPWLMLESSEPAPVALLQKPVKEQKYRNILQSLRKRNGLTLKEASAKIGITMGYLNCLEWGRSLPSLEIAFKIAKFYQYKIEEIWSLQGLQ